MTSTPETRAAERAARKTARKAATPVDRCKALTEALSAATGIAWTFGYIGNVSHHGDDRSWFAFAEHPGRVGTSDDRIGGLPGHRLDELATMLQGALLLARVQGARR